MGIAMGCHVGRKLWKGNLQKVHECGLSRLRVAEVSMWWDFTMSFECAALISSLLSSACMVRCVADLLHAQEDSSFVASFHTFLP